MDVLMLGTGAADGWPNPFCECASCEAALEAGEIRTPTSVLVDDKVWIDPGPEAPRQAVRFGRRLASVELVLVGHVHTDHLDPAFLLHRSWVNDSPLLLAGPAPVIDECRNWLKPGQTAVTLLEVTAGDRFEHADYEIEVLAASHEALGEAVLYRISDGNSVLLYACDTGPWATGVVEQLAGRRVDLLILEQSFGERADLAGERHHHIGSFLEAVAELRECGVVDDRTQVVAAHMSHHNNGEVLDVLDSAGVHVARDGLRLVC